MHVWFMLSREILVSWMQIACLVAVEEDESKLSNDYVTLCVVFTFTISIGHVSVKCHEKSTTNIINSFCSNNETKIFLYPLFHP